MRILKQVLEIKDEERYFFPGKEIRLISVAEQRKNLVLYFETDATEDEIISGNKQAVGTIYIVGTGQQREDMPPDAKFIGTVVMSYGLVWHCYGKTEVSEKRKTEVVRRGIIAGTMIAGFAGTAKSEIRSCGYIEKSSVCKTKM